MSRKQRAELPKPVRGLARVWLALRRAPTEQRRFALLVPLVGLVTGSAAVAIIKGIAILERWIWGGDHILESSQHASPALRLLAPAIGGLVVGIILRFGRLPNCAQGTGALVEAIALRGGHVPLRQAALTQLAGMVSVGSGGSLGREGPIIHTGATLASTLGDRLGLSGHRLRILVGCGAAAGMAAAYNAPFGGTVFAMEVILGNFALDIFGPLVIAAVMATLVSREFLSASAVYDIPAYTFEGGWELPLYALLGLVAGVLAVIFIVAVRQGEVLFDRLKLPNPLRATLGFLVVGCLGLTFPYVYGNGSDTVDLALSGKLDLRLLLLLPLVKLIATAATTGGGGRGGLFTPSLFVGALIGGAFGLGVHQLFPIMGSPSGAYALVGMAAIAAGTTHAPLAAILVVFEMTGRYELILPLMAACILANLVSRAIKPESIYMAPLSRRGVKLPTTLEELVMEQTSVRDVLREDPDVLRDATPFASIVQRFLDARRNHLYVVDEDGRLLGAVSIHDIKHVLAQGENLAFVMALDILHRDFPSVCLDDRLTSVLEQLGSHAYERLPAVDNATDRRFQGFVAKRDVIAIYNQEVLHKPALLAKFTKEDSETTYVELPPSHAVAQVEVPDSMVDRSLAKLRLTARYDAYVLEIKRQVNDREERQMPHPSSVLRKGDRLIVVAPLARIDDLKRGI